MGSDKEKTATSTLPQTINDIATRFDTLASSLRAREAAGKPVAATGKVVKEAILATFASATPEEAERVVEQLLLLLSSEPE